MKIVAFSETIEACDLKVGRYRQLIDFMKVCAGSQMSDRCPLDTFFLAHLSRWLICELIGYSWSIVHPSVVHPQCSKISFLQNRLANQSQILCGASLGRGNESLFVASGSHDQDGRHAHIW